MKSTGLSPLFACLGLIVATCAHASGLRLTPAHPAINQPFVIDFDYVTTCSGPMNAVSAELQPPNPALDFTFVGVGSTIQCFDTTASHTVHVTAPMTGLGPGTYPIYSLIGILNGFLPYLDTLQQGSVTVAAGDFSTVPAMSTWGCAVLIFAIGLLAIGARAQRERRR